MLYIPPCQPSSYHKRAINLFKFLKVLKNFPIISIRIFVRKTIRTSYAKFLITSSFRDDDGDLYQYNPQNVIF